MQPRVDGEDKFAVFTFGKTESQWPCRPAHPGNGDSGTLGAKSGRDGPRCSTGGGNGGRLGVGLDKQRWDWILTPFDASA